MAQALFLPEFSFAKVKSMHIFHPLAIINQNYFYGFLLNYNI